MSTTTNSPVSPTVLKVAMGSAAAFFLYLSLRQAAREVTPRPLGLDPILSLVNFSEAAAGEFEHVLPSWTGAITTAQIDDVVLFPDDTVNSDVDAVRSEARQGYFARLASLAKEHGAEQQQLLHRPVTLAMRTSVEIAGSTDLDPTLSPFDIARKCVGLPMEVTCLLAMCTGPKDGDVDLFKSTVGGQVTSVEFLEKLAAVRQKQSIAQHRSSSNVNANVTDRSIVSSATAAAFSSVVASSTTSSSSTPHASARNFITLEDLFEPSLPTSLLDDKELQWQRLFAGLSSAKTSPPSYVQQWRDSKIAQALQQQHGEGLQQSQQEAASATMSSLLLAPWRYRAFIQVAFSLMYGQLERKHGALFDGVYRGVAHGASTVKNFFSIFSSTGAIANAGRKAKSWFSSGLSSSSSSKDQQQKSSAAAAIDPFTSKCTSDFGYDSSDPLCGRFEVHITVVFKPTEAEHQVATFTNFADSIGLKIVRIELPVGQHPTQLMTSFYMQGRVDRCTAGAFNFALQLHLATGLEIARVKLELQLTDDRAQLKLRATLAAQNKNNNNNKNISVNAAVGAVRPFLLADGPGLGLCPVRDFEARNTCHMTPTQYFEFHIKLCLRSGEQLTAEVLPAVKRVCGRHDAHLSLNAFKPSSSDDSVDAAEREKDNKKVLFYFVTLRLYAVGLITSLEKLDDLKADLEQVLASLSEKREGGVVGDDSEQEQNRVPRIHSMQREFAVFDTSAALDRGWIDHKVTSMGP